MKKEIVIKTDQLTKNYGNTVALQDADITICKGEIYGLVGNNGAGKTTFLKLLTGEIVPTGGGFTLLGENTEKGYIKARKRMGAIIENPAFFPGMSAMQNLEYYRIQRGIPGKEVVKQTLECVGLSEAENKKFKNMSLGMKQRLGLGLALMGEPELLVLDEPINGLDPSGIIEIRNLLLKLNQEKGVTMIISSHILAELSNVATQYGFLSKGKVVEQISAEELREKSQDYLEIRVTDIEKYVSLLERKLACKNYKVMSDGSIHVYGKIDKLTEYSALASNHEIGLLFFGMKEVNLENYYMEIIGETVEAEGDK